MKKVTYGDGTTEMQIDDYAQANSGVRGIIVFMNREIALLRTSDGEAPYQDATIHLRLLARPAFGATIEWRGKTPLQALPDGFVYAFDDRLIHRAARGSGLRQPICSRRLSDHGHDSAFASVIGIDRHQDHPVVLCGGCERIARQDGASERIVGLREAHEAKCAEVTKALEAHRESFAFAVASGNRKIYSGTGSFDVLVGGRKVTLPNPHGMTANEVAAAINAALGNEAGYAKAHRDEKTERLVFTVASGSLSPEAVERIENFLNGAGVVEAPIGISIIKESCSPEGFDTNGGRGWLVDSDGLWHPDAGDGLLVKTLCWLFAWHWPHVDAAPAAAPKCPRCLALRSEVVPNGAALLAERQASRQPRSLVTPWDPYDVG